MFELLDWIADAVGPVLALAVIGVTIADWRSRGKRIAIATLICVAIVYLIQAIDHAFGIWHRFGGDYSTHLAFAIAMSFSLFMARPRWRVIVIAILAGYAVLILVLRYHTAADLLSTAAVAIATMLPVFVAFRSH